MKQWRVRIQDFGTYNQPYIHIDNEYIYIDGYVNVYAVAAVR